MQKKIAHIVTGNIWGGIEQMIYSWSLALKERGYTVYIVIQKGELEFAEIFSKVAIVQQIDFEQQAYMQKVFQLRAFMKKERIGIVNVHNNRMAYMLALVKAFVPGLKLVSFRHNVLKTKGDLFHDFLYARVDRFICVSNAVHQAQLLNIRPYLQPRFIKVYNGININNLKIAPAKSINKSEPFKIGYAGRITEGKGIHILLEAAKSAQANLSRPVQVIIAGKPHTENDNAYKAFLEQLIAQLGMQTQVVFLGFCEDMSEFYQQIDLLILPSVIKEGFGLVLCEAMFFSVPVITTDTGGQIEIIQHEENGLVVSADNVEELSAAICKLLNNPTFAEQLITQAKKDFHEKYTLEICMDKLEKIYREL